MKRFIHFSAHLFLVFFIFFGCAPFPFEQIHIKEEDEIIEVESDCGFDADIEITIEDVEIEMSCQGHWEIKSIEAPREDMIYTITEQSATFKGGMDYFKEIVNNQMRFSATMKEGRVFIQFVVDTTGKMTDLKVVKKAVCCVPVGIKVLTGTLTS